MKNIPLFGPKLKNIQTVEENLKLDSPAKPPAPGALSVTRCHYPAAPRVTRRLPLVSLTCIKALPLCITQCYKAPAPCYHHCYMAPCYTKCTRRQRHVAPAPCSTECNKVQVSCSTKCNKAPCHTLVIHGAGALLHLVL